MEWRPPLWYAYPLGHRVPAILRIPGKTERQHTRLGARCTRGAMRGAASSLIGVSVLDTTGQRQPCVARLPSPTGPASRPLPQAKPAKEPKAKMKTIKWPGKAPEYLFQYRYRSKPEEVCRAAL